MSRPLILLAFAAVCCTFAWHFCRAEAPSAASSPQVESAPASAEPRLSYNRDVRPILSNNCFRCHGPDAHDRKAEMRLDIAEEAKKETPSGVFPIVPGKPDESEIITRIFDEDESVIMPPPDSHKKLTDRERQILRRWVAEGAEYQPHWSFIAPLRPELPRVQRTAWVRNGIDRFILARLERDGIAPSPEADRAMLLRRLSFDLTGLPPTPAELDAFLLDNGPDAYEKVVDRLLASPHFGERLAVDWLDAARYADTNGYSIDNGRDMTRWRDWVINAFNNNLPYDQFLVEQIAGDLLPEATLEQRIASGFNRNHGLNFEGGTIPEEYHTAYILDRVNTMGTAMLGLTVACSQCHDHKYDPLTQNDYYRLYAFFNNVDEQGLDGKKGNAVPLLKLPSARQEKSLARVADEIQTIEDQIVGPLPAADEAQAAWEVAAAGYRAVEWRPAEATSITAESGATLTQLDDGSYLASGINAPTDVYTITLNGSGNVTALRLEALPDPSLPGRGPGRSEEGNCVLTNVDVARMATDNPSAVTTVKLTAAEADFSQRNFGIELAIDDKPATGWAIYPKLGTAHTATFELAEPLSLDGGQAIVKLYFQSVHPGHQLGRFRLSTTDVPDALVILNLPAKLKKVLSTPTASRNEKQQAELRKYYRENVSPLTRELTARLKTLRARKEDLEGAIPTTMVMQEMSRPRDTFLLIRGQYDQHGEKVAPAPPAFLPPLADDAPPNRLGLARWMVAPTNPLVSRVAVNRTWQMFFGLGLVKTAEDFGLQGELPSHSELLDWLSLELQHSTPAPDGTGSSAPWDTKALCRLIVMSATYRQSSQVRPELLAADPENRLLARAPRNRLSAEFIRDTALSAAGLLNDKIGGEAVFPYQPAGLWEETSYDPLNFTAQTYTQSHGADLYRRSLYTFWKRTSPPPNLTAFDAPSRETCTVRRGTTNTPLQALVLLNDPTYVEAARKLAERLLTATPAGVDDRIAFAFRLLTARPPTPSETAVLRRLLNEQLSTYRADVAAAEHLLAVGESKRSEKLDTAELAAWTVVASALLNLDETVTKN